MKTCGAVLAGAALGVATSFVTPSSAHDAALPQEQPASAVVVPPPVTGFPIGWCIRARPEVFNDAKRVGFEYVELALQDVLGLSNAEFETLRAELESTGLRALSGYNPIPAELKIVGPDLDRVKEETHLRTLLSRAAALKLTYIIFNSGGSWRVPDGVAVDDAFAQLTAFARRFAEAAARDHITVLVEPLRSTDSNLITTVARHAPARRDRQPAEFRHDGRLLVSHYSRRSSIRPRGGRIASEARASGKPGQQADLSDGRARVGLRRVLCRAETDWISGRNERPCYDVGVCD